MKCVKCKKEIDKEDIFCGYCGINQAKFTKYLESVSKKIHKERDKEYNSKVSMAENEVERLEKEREQEINNIFNERWETYDPIPFSYNMTEGIINIDGDEYPFSDIHGASLVKEDSIKTITTTTGKTKKHASLGKAVVGGVIMGPLGAAAGATMGKNTTTANSVTNEIHMCNFIGVKVNVEGFEIQIPVLNKTVDQSSKTYINSLDKANEIVNKLQKLSKTKVPNNFVKIEKEESVLEYDRLIKDAKAKLKDVKADKPNYDIPESYFE